MHKTGSVNMDINPIHGTPLLMIEGENGEKALVGSDPHIGIEEEYRKKGVYIPPRWKKICSMILNAAEKNRPDRLIFLGDVKHRIAPDSEREAKWVKNFFACLTEKVSSVEIIPGNHDGMIYHMLPENVALHPVRGISIENVGLVHGHAWPSPSIAARKLLIMGHVHPHVEFREEIGTRRRVPCWVRAVVSEKMAERYETYPREVIIVPPISDLHTGCAVNMGEGVGPLFKNRLVVPEKMDIYLLNGVYLGKAADIV